MKHITILAIEKCMTSAVVALHDIFAIANLCCMKHDPTGDFPFFSVDVVTEDGNNVLSFNNLTLQADHSCREAKQTDIVIVPPVLDDLNTMVGDHPQIVEWLKTQHDEGAILASVCTGIFFIADTGFLNGRSCTTNPSAAFQFSQRYPEIQLKLNEIIVDEGDIITSGSSLSFLDLYIYIIERFCGNEVAVDCSKMMLLEKNRHSQAPFFMTEDKSYHNDPDIQKAQDYLNKNFTEAISVESLAAELGMSLRNFFRRFKIATGTTVLKYLQNLRVNKARSYLENTQLTVDEITYKIGYDDSSSFGRLFKKKTELSPSAYRKKFSPYK